MKFIDLTGKKFGRLMVLKLAGKSKPGAYKWSCICDCGASAVILGSLLRDGCTKSCGCLLKELTGLRFRKHGHAKQVRGSEYNTWLLLRNRCLNPKHKRYKDYGGRGITVCERWSSFENFLSDMGERPSKDYTLDRIDNNKGYSPDNCRWATRIQQGSNTRRNRILTHNGTSLTVADWSRRLGIPSGVIYSRLFNNWDISRALSPKLFKKFNKQNNYE